MHRTGQRPARFLALPLLGWLLLSPSVGVAEIDHAKEYKACLTLVYRAPAKAYESAQAWEAKGGGISARHCAALALFEQGLQAEAAEQLEKLAADSPRDGPVSPAEFLAQAANIWLLMGDVERAKRDINAAAKLAPDNVGVLVDQARVAAEEGAYADALRALDRAIELQPTDSEAHTFRAAALRRLGRLDAALAAIDEALRLNADNPSAWLERGLIHLDSGDPAAAKRDWETTVDRFDGTPAAETAAVRLNALEETTN